jgi:hypothetical protein
MIYDLRNMNKSNGGYIALISVIIISLILVGLTSLLSSGGYFTRASAANSEYKRISLGLAESCVNAALLKIGQNFDYSPELEGGVVQIGDQNCEIVSVGSGTNRTIVTKASFQGAFSSMSITVNVQDPNQIYIPPTILVATVIVPAGANLADFPLSLDGTSITSGQTNTVSAGAHTVHVDSSPAGYSTTGWAGACASDGTIMLEVGDAKSCYINYTVQPTTAKLTLIANIPAGADQSDFPLQIDGQSEIDEQEVVSGHPIDVAPGTHTASYTMPASGYQASEWSGACDPDTGVTGTLNVGQNYTCVINFSVPNTACADTVMILDRTGSMSTAALADERAAAKALLDLYSPLSPAPKVSIGVFNDGTNNSLAPAKIINSLTDNYTSLYHTLNDTGGLLYHSGGYTNLQSAIDKTQTEFTNNGSHNPDGSSYPRVFILISDGQPNRPSSGGGGSPTTQAMDAAYSSADNAKMANTNIYGIHFGTTVDTPEGINSQEYLARLSGGIVPNPPHQPGSIVDHFLNTDTGLSSSTLSGNPNEWSNGKNAFASDNSYANTNNDNDDQGYRNFGFNIPSNSTINGIEVALEAHQEGTTCQLQARLSWNNGNNDTDRKTVVPPSSDSILTLGGHSDTWGRTWSSSDFTNANFVLEVRYNDPGSGCGNNDDIFLDHAQVKVYYFTVDAAAENADGDNFYISPMSADMEGIFEDIGKAVCPAAVGATQAKMNVITQVINSNGGVGQPGDFHITISGASVSPSSFDGSESGTEVIVAQDTSFNIDVTTSLTNYYAPQYIGCSTTNNSVAAGETIYCTIVNYDKPPDSTYTPPPIPPENIIIGTWEEKP